MSLVAFPSIDPVTDESSDTGELVFMPGLYLNVKPFRKHALNMCRSQARYWSSTSLRWPERWTVEPPDAPVKQQITASENGWDQITLYWSKGGEIPSVLEVQDSGQIGGVILKVILITLLSHSLQHRSRPGINIRSLITFYLWESPSIMIVFMDFMVLVLMFRWPHEADMFHSK